MEGGAAHQPAEATAALSGKEAALCRQDAVKAEADAVLRSGKQSQAALRERAEAMQRLIDENEAQLKVRSSKPKSVRALYSTPISAHRAQTLTVN